MSSVRPATIAASSSSARAWPRVRRGLPYGSQGVGIGLVLGGLLSQEFGAAVATSLFPRAGAAGIVTLRLVLSAALLLAVCRPRVRGHRRADWVLVVGFGASLAGMNFLFYQSITRIPLGAAVTFEVLGPLVLSVVLARRAASWLWAGLALAGVALLSRGGFGRLDAAGVAFALGAAALWAAYILMSARAGGRFPGADGLALAMAVAAALSLPVGVADAGGALLDPVTLGLGMVVAVLSSAFPYSLELLALRCVTPSVFGVVSTLAPVVAVAAGYLVLGQVLALVDIVAIALVVAATAGAVRTAWR
ncbi:EamA family transporter [Streptomyces arenae]|uniref:EamA family transporter n=1 Tax=Streptomyces arenae TaxID=29301 RepID=UPI00265A965B|nr:EamA family transporter [Streptomyces arenae]MCG7209629.1 EamA family transporter [Streptomyces arenae]